MNGHAEGRTTTIETLTLAQRIAELALEKKATDLTVLDVRQIVSYSDYIVICSATSERQVKAIADGLEETLAAEDHKPVGIEGAQNSRWVLIDYGDVVVHVFTHPVRAFYDIDGLWPEAPEVEVPGYDRKRDVGYANFA